MRAACGAAEGGFTLVEMLLGMTLFSMVLMLAYGGLFAGARAVDSGERLVDRSNHLRIVHRFVRRQLAQAMPLQITSDDSLEDDELVYFEGDARSLHFAAPMPGYLSSGGPHEQRLFLKRGSRGYTLFFGHRVLSREEDWPEGMEEREPVPLLSGIDRGEFTYLLIDDEGEPEWLSDWEEPAVLPVAVRIELRLEDGSQLSWPTLEVRPMIDAASARFQVDRPFVLPGGSRDRN